MEPLESLLLVFEPKMIGEPHYKTEIDTSQYIVINTPWQLSLQPVQGEKFDYYIPELIDFGSSNDEQLNTFAGIVLYSTTFELIDTQYIELDLGNVKGISEVTLNGESLGVRWWGRHKYNIRKSLLSDKNIIEIKLTTVLSNYCRSLKNNPTALKWTEGRESESIGLLGPVRLYKMN